MASGVASANPPISPIFLQSFFLFLYACASICCGIVSVCLFRHRRQSIGKASVDLIVWFMCVVFGVLALMQSVFFATKLITGSVQSDLVACHVEAIASCVLIVAQFCCVVLSAVNHWLRFVKSADLSVADTCKLFAALVMLSGLGTAAVRSVSRIQTMPAGVTCMFAIDSPAMYAWIMPIMTLSVLLLSGLYWSIFKQARHAIVRVHAENQQQSLQARHLRQKSGHRLGFLTDSNLEATVGANRRAPVPASTPSTLPQSQPLTPTSLSPPGSIPAGEVKQAYVSASLHSQILLPRVITSPTPASAPKRQSGSRAMFLSVPRHSSDFTFPGPYSPSSPPLQLSPPLSSPLMDKSLFSKRLAAIRAGDESVDRAAASTVTIMGQTRASLVPRLPLTLVIAKEQEQLSADRPGGGLASDTQHQPPSPVATIQIQPKPSPRQVRNAARTMQRLSGRSMTMVLMFTIGWCPLAILYAVNATHPDNAIALQIIDIVYITFIAVHALLIPIVYVVQNPKLAKFVKCN